MDNSYVKQQINRIKRLINKAGTDLTIELKPRLVEIDGETMWVVEPRRLKRMTTAQFIQKHMIELARKIAPIGTETLTKHEKNFLLYTAKKVVDDPSRAWVREFARMKSDAYLSDGGFLRRDVSDRLKGLCKDEGYKNINNIITTGIMNNENPALMRSKIRENVFGLAPGERNKGLTSRSDMILRTELSYSERNVNREVMRQDPEKVGVRLHFYGGPCPSGICPSILRGGYDVKVSGSELTADFYYDMGIPWPPFHPNCHCLILRFLYREDLEKRGEPGGTMPKKVLEKIFVEEKGGTGVFEGIKELTEKEKGVIRDYTEDHYRTVNSMLREGNDLTRGMSGYDSVGDYVNVMDSALEKMEPYEGKTWRMVDISKNSPDFDEFLDSHREGSIVNYKAYTSTTADEGRFVGPRLKLEINGKTGRDISEYASEVVNESEVLFPRNAKFVVREIVTDGGDYLIKMDEL